MARNSHYYFAVQHVDVALDADLTLPDEFRAEVKAVTSELIRLGIVLGCNDDDLRPEFVPFDCRMLDAITPYYLMVLEWLKAHADLHVIQDYLHVPGNPIFSRAKRFSFGVQYIGAERRYCKASSSTYQLTQASQRRRDELFGSGDKQTPAAQNGQWGTDTTSWQAQSWKRCHFHIEPTDSLKRKEYFRSLNDLDFCLRDMSDQHGRLYSTLTQMNKEDRNRLRIGSRAFHQIDLSSAFPVFAAIATGRYNALADIAAFKDIIGGFFRSGGWQDFTADDVKLFRTRVIMNSVGIEFTNDYNMKRVLRCKATFLKYLKTHAPELHGLLNEWYAVLQKRTQSTKQKPSQIALEVLGDVEGGFLGEVMQWCERLAISAFRIHDCIMVPSDETIRVADFMIALGEERFHVTLGIESPVHAKTFATSLPAADTVTIKSIDGCLVRNQSLYYVPAWFTTLLDDVRFDQEKQRWYQSKAIRRQQKAREHTAQVAFAA